MFFKQLFHLKKNYTPTRYLQTKSLTLKEHKLQGRKIIIYIKEGNKNIRKKAQNLRRYLVGVEFFCLKSSVNHFMQQSPKILEANTICSGLVSKT